MNTNEKQIQIGELAKITGTSIRMIRYFDKHGLISPAPRKPRGYRLFNQTHVAQIHWVKKMQQLGFSLAEVREVKDIEGSNLADDEKEQALKIIYQSKLDEVENQIARLRGVQMLLKEWASLRPPRAR